MPINSHAFLGWKKPSRKQHQNERLDGVKLSGGNPLIALFSFFWGGRLMGFTGIPIVSGRNMVLLGFFVLSLVFIFRLNLKYGMVLECFF